jgi:hypothetical protein
LAEKFVTKNYSGWSGISTGTLTVKNHRNVVAGFCCWWLQTLASPLLCQR